MASLRESQIFIDDFSGGLNLKDSPYFIRPTQAAFCENFIFTRTGGAFVRRGYSPFGEVDTEAPISGIHRHVAGNTAQLIVASDGKIFVDSELEYENLNPLAWYTFATWDWKNRCFIANGIDPLMVWDGESMDLVSGAPPVSQFVTVYANRLWVAGDPADPTILRWSALGDYEDWPAANFAAALGPITGLVPGFGQLYILEPDRIEVLIGTGGATTTSGIQPLMEGAGCIAPRSVATYAGLTFFLGQEGVWQFTGSTINLVSRDIEPAVTGLTPLQKSEAVGVIYDGRYWLSLPEGGRRVIYVYDIHGGWWTKFTDIDARAFAVFQHTKDSYFLISGDSEGKLWRQDHGELDNGEWINATWTSKIFLVTPDWNVQFREIYLRTFQMYGNLRIYWDIDFGRERGLFSWDRINEEYLWGKARWGIGKWSGHIPLRFKESYPMKAVGESIQFTIKHRGRGGVHHLINRVRPKRRVR